jgi:predicted nucleotidyltransferase
MLEVRTKQIQVREALLTHITNTLKSDERFVAAWLAGSYARGEQKWSSDLDLHVVVANDYSELLCAQPWSSGAKTTQERLRLFKQFGEPAIIYDAHVNNTIGGTFTYVLYRESAINVDWMLVPQSVAHLEYPSRMLFNHVTLPEPPSEQPLSREQQIEQASLYVGFFWMIAASNVQNLLNDHLVQFHTLLRWLEDSIREVRSALIGEQAAFTKTSRIQLCCTQEEQVAVLRSLCDEMESLMPSVIDLGGYVPASPRSVIEMRLLLLS